MVVVMMGIAGPTRVGPPVAVAAPWRFERDGGVSMALSAEERLVSFDAFYAATAPGLLRQLHAFTGDFGDAQDVLQEAYARAWDRWALVMTYDVPREWVRTVAVRLAISRFRKVKRTLAAYTRHGVEDVVPAMEPDAHGVLDVLRQLPDKMREVLVLHYLVDLPIADIAEQLGVPQGTVKARLSRGRTAFAALAGDTYAFGAGRQEAS
jgi:RNA polymerase sigma-70 factor (ECF subfamily)